MTKSLGEPERVAEERKSLNSTLDTLKKAVKVLQRDPDITNTAFGDDELEESLKRDAMDRRRDEEQKKRGGPPPGSVNSSFRADSSMSMSSNQSMNMGGGGAPNRGPMQNAPNPHAMGMGGVAPGGGVRPQGQPMAGQPVRHPMPAGGVQPPPGTGTLFAGGAGNPLK